MPKTKTNRAAMKRFKISATGKLMRKHAFKNHILTKKSKKRKRALGHKGVVAATDYPRIVQLLTS